MTVFFHNIILLIIRILCNKSTITVQQKHIQYLELAEDSKSTIFKKVDTEQV